MYNFLKRAIGFSQIIAKVLSNIEIPKTNRYLYFKKIILCKHYIL